MLDITVVTIAWLAFAAAAAGLVMVALRAITITAGVVGLAVLLGQQALSTTLSLFAFASDASIAVWAFRIAVVVWLLWAPCVALAGALLLWNSSRAKISTAFGILVGAPNLLLLVAALFSPSLIYEEGAMGVTPLAGLLIVGVFIAILGFSLLLALEGFTTPLELRRAQFSLLAIAFLLEGMYHASQNSFKVGLGVETGGFGGLPVPTKIALLVPLVVGLVLLVIGTIVALDGRTKDARRWAMVLVGALLLAGISGAATARLAPADEFHDGWGIFHALWDLAGILVLVFAALRFQLVAMHMHARRAIVISTVIALAFLVFTTVENLAQNFVEDRYLEGLPAPGIISGIVVALALLPLVKGAETLGRRIFPESGGKNAAAQRNEQIYQAALEGAFLDGHVEPREARSLTLLRKTLSISDETHDAIEAKVRAALATRVEDASPSLSPA